MTFAPCCHDSNNNNNNNKKKRNRMAKIPLSLSISLSLAFGYAMGVAAGSKDIVRTADCDFTDERVFGNSIRVLGARRLGSGSSIPWVELTSWCSWKADIDAVYSAFSTAFSNLK